MRPILLLSAAFAAMAQAPAPFTFGYQTASNPAVAAVVPNGSIVFPLISVNAAATVTFVVRSAAAAEWAIADATAEGGGFSAQASGVPLPANGTASFPVTLNPRAAGPASGVLTVRLRGPAGESPSFAFLLNAVISTSDLLTSFVINPDGNQTLIESGGTIRFPDTAVGSQATASFIVSNRGPNAVLLAAIGVAGEGYELRGLPLLPAQIPSGQDVRFVVAFAPKARAGQQGSLALTIGADQHTFALTGQGVGAALSYEVLADAGPTQVAPDGVIQFPPAAANSGRSSVALRIRNTGNAEARITNVTVTGSAFQTVDLSPLPAVVAAGQTFTLTLQFTPRETGELTGRLRIDGALFTLGGTGQGARLSLRLVLGDTRTPISNASVGLLPNTTVGGRLPFVIEIANEGNLAASVRVISLTGGNFSIPQPPSLPATIEAGAVLPVPVVFAPTSVGTQVGTLQVETQTISLRAIAAVPPPLTGVSFTGAPEQAAPLEQPSVGIELANPYPIPITGRLTLTFVSDAFVDDPSVQFVSGGRTVDFRIPENSTRAVFGATAGSIRLQTGTVAGAITLSATFSAGAVELPAAEPAFKTIVVPASAPHVRSVQVGARSAGGFELLITGHSTTRSVSKLNFQLTASPGANLQTTTLTADVESGFNAWFQSTASRAFGSQFTLSVTFNLNGEIGAIQSIAVTAVNAKGESAPRSVTLQ